MTTHEVTNQVPPLEGANLFTTNVPLVEALDREGGSWAHDRVTEAGRGPRPSHLAVAEPVGPGGAARCRRGTRRPWPGSS